MPSACNLSDVTVAPALLERVKPMRYLISDKGYDADRLRRSLRAAGITPVIPGRRNRGCVRAAADSSTEPRELILPSESAPTLLGSVTRTQMIKPPSFIRETLPDILRAPN